MHSISDFDILIKKSYDFNQEIFDSNPNWSLLRDLYNNNFVNHTEERNYSVLPKKIHQIWFGGKMPDKYAEMCKSWSKFNPDWEYRLWTEKDINDVKIHRRRLFDSITHLGQKSDYFRYQILNQYGGLYVDTDFECLKSFDSLTYANFITGIGYPSNVELYIGLIGCTPHHPIMEQIVKAMIRANANGWRNIFETTGTYFFTRNFFRMVNKDSKGILALPPDYFYPMPNYVRHNVKDSKEYIDECSFALHHWAVLWSKKRR